MEDLPDGEKLAPTEIPKQGRIARVLRKLKILPSPKPLEPLYMREPDFFLPDAAYPLPGGGSGEPDTTESRLKAILGEDYVSPPDKEV